MKRPNILYIHSHDTGRYVGPYGYPVGTPNIQKLAEGGVLFRQAFCAAPTCSPSRAALLTGQCAHQAGMLGLVNRGFDLETPERHMATVFRQAGYETVLVGMQHVTRDAKRLGYERVLEAQGKWGWGVTPTAVEFLNNRPSEPFFMSVGFYQTHRPFPAPTGADDPRYLRPAAPFADTPQARRDMAAFCASARQLDLGIGQVLAALDAAGLAENTLVVCTTDHGIAFPSMKCNLTDHGIGVMLIVRGPGGFAGGKVIDSLASHLDIFPTICELAGVDRPGWLEGYSLVPLVTGRSHQVRDAVHAEVNYHCAYEPMRCVRTERYKYIRRWCEYPHPVTSHCDDGPTKTLWLAQGWLQRTVPPEQLYDLVFDPNETHNVADDPDYAPVLAEMQGRLQQWMEQTADPLLAGPVEAPQSAIAGKPEDTLPSDVWKRRPKPPGYS